MASHSMSDTIEEYLKQMLVSSDEEEVEIRRSDIAEHFDVVPSQINYVIKTRFALQDGYIVQSKRGGGGYIRIEKINLMEDSDVFDRLINSISDRISQKEEEDILHTLFNNDLLSDREVNMVASILTHDAINVSDPETEEKVRANVLSALLCRLKYEC
ncbi:CtsR family transcriptional regulator [Fructilactobacillus lindneri]|nr:CtsR family transcriptional regulator [Fructilactobacillus lindneri]ANZ57914.1 CtsR family transcriptional regulator [Fructilactobacillus lindneri]ANZ59184.1 CtsR family transcriptional regulator [Fructilactobacillus lindneri]POG98234.1 CtsR family transcriptional regulator [Fructilactobacillus lindneri]POH01649.1 CtsR family transcriptional regulator [Fructilactobacillus lindneri]POH03492.1 CtsR family transcriptional regulator [Fructilactobacillus lindneri]